MKRRAFVSMLIGGTGALVLPAWRTPERVIFVPPREAMSTQANLRLWYLDGLMPQIQPMDYGLGVAQVKREGGAILYDIHSWDEWSYAPLPGWRRA